MLLTKDSVFDINQMALPEFYANNKFSDDFITKYGYDYEKQFYGKFRWSLFSQFYRYIDLELYLEHGHRISMFYILQNKKLCMSTIRHLIPVVLQQENGEDLERLLQLKKLKEKDLINMVRGCSHPNYVIVKIFRYQLVSNDFIMNFFVPNIKFFGLEPVLKYQNISVEMFCQLWNHPLFMQEFSKQDFIQWHMSNLRNNKKLSKKNLNNILAFISL